MFSVQESGAIVDLSISGAKVQRCAFGQSLYHQNQSSHNRMLLVLYFEG